MDHYKFNYQGNDKHLKYFADTPCKNWSFKDFSDTFQRGRRTKAKENTLLSNYLNALKTISQTESVSDNVKSITKSLMNEVRLIMEYTNTRY